MTFVLTGGAGSFGGGPYTPRTLHSPGAPASGLLGGLLNRPRMTGDFAELMRQDRKQLMSKTDAMLSQWRKETAGSSWRGPAPGSLAALMNASALWDAAQRLSDLFRFPGQMGDEMVMLTSGLHPGLGWDPANHLFLRFEGTYTTAPTAGALPATRTAVPVVQSVPRAISSAFGGIYLGHRPEVPPFSITMPLDFVTPKQTAASFIPALEDVGRPEDYAVGEPVGSPLPGRKVTRTFRGYYNSPWQVDMRNPVVRARPVTNISLQTSPSLDGGPPRVSLRVNTLPIRPKKGISEGKGKLPAGLLAAYKIIGHGAGWATESADFVNILFAAAFDGAHPEDYTTIERLRWLMAGGILNLDVGEFIDGWLANELEDRFIGGLNRGIRHNLFDGGNGLWHFMSGPGWGLAL